MTDKVNLSFKISTLADRIGLGATEGMTGRTKKGPYIQATATATAPTSATGEATKTQEGTSKATSSRQIMENFVQTGTPGKRRADNLSPQDNSAKRTAEKNDDTTDSEADAEELAWQQELRKEIIKEVGITTEQADRVMGVVMKAFKLRVVEMARKMAKQVVTEEKEVRRSSKSIIMHRADQWVGAETGPLNLNLAERVTMAIYGLAGGAVTVLDAFTLGRWDAQTPPTAVMITFGSRMQKTTFFKILAKRAAMGGQAASKLKAISCRDAFPKKFVENAKELAQKGRELKQNEAVAFFRVVARGIGCHPVLEVKGWGADGKKEPRWTVHTEERAGAEAEAGMERTGTGDEAEWQTVARGRGREKRGGRPPVTPRKPAGSSSRMTPTVPQPQQRRPPPQGGFSDAEETVFHPNTEEEMYIEDF
jgi:hypothetical protein